MNRQRHDVAGAESVLAFNNRVLTRLELHMRAICALPLDAATNGDVPNLKLADRIQASRCCKTLRYKHTVRITLYFIGMCSGTNYSRIALLFLFLLHSRWFVSIASCSTSWISVTARPLPTFAL